eukprot:TRINITY_DN1689_c0_g1_i14.p1 TRINITY_DN1689_c0_g1~~TRINITY_DN1689_c0_g1_i14.p1  ORF type:complete len:603 (+),score=142.15 TRINITY_DN1689_c0_g1_i14:66-1874(+)
MCIRDREYSDFIYELMNDLDVQLKEAKDRPNPGLLELAKLGLLYFFAATIRSKQRDPLPRFLKTIKHILTLSSQVSCWLLNVFTNPDVIKEFLVDCPIADMRYFVYGVLRYAFKSQYDVEVKECATYEEYKEKAQTARTINCLIYVLCECKKSFRVLDQLMNIFSYYSKLGAYTKKLLLEKRMISKFVLFLSDPNQTSPSDVKDFEKDLNRGMLEMGQPKAASTQNKIQFRTIDDVLEKKREKNLQDTQIPNFKHLIVMFSNIATSVALNGDQSVNGENPYASSEDLAAIEKEEIEWILNAGFWRKLMNESTTKLSRKYTARFFTYLAFNSEERYKAIFQFLATEVNDKDDSNLKAPLITLCALVEINDQFRQNRLELGYQLLTNAIKDNISSLYLRSSEYCVDYLFKLTARDKGMYDIFVDDKVLQKKIENWIKDCPNYTQALLSDRLKLFKRKQYSLNPNTINQQNLQQKLMTKYQDRLNKLRAILKGPFDALSANPIFDYDSDEDLAEHEFKKEEKLEYTWGSNEWVPAVVIETLEEMIRIEYGEGRGTSRWVFYDSEQLAPPNKGATRARDWFEGSRLLKQSTQTIHVLQGVCVCLSV